MPRAILFDMDGTLVDTRAASWPLFAETNREFALGIDTREAFFRIFEGNFFESLARLCADAARFDAVKRHFMELLRTRYRPALIPGMRDVVRALAPHCTLAVLSTNGIEAIRHILVEAGIATCFSHVFSGDVQPRKSESMRCLLGDQRYGAQRCCSPAYREDAPSDGALGADDVVLVTDTSGDVAEAREVGIAAIGVVWGMHNERQLLEAGARKVALWPQELVAWLRPENGSSACDCDSSCAHVADSEPHARALSAAVPPQPVGTISASVAALLQTAGSARQGQRLQRRRAQAAASAGAFQATVTRPSSRTTLPADPELLGALRRVIRRPS